MSLLLAASVLGQQGGLLYPPAEISGLHAGFAADRITGLVNADPVATWADLSGGGRNATQATPANRPLYKTAVLNGLPVVEFASGVTPTDMRLVTAAWTALSQPNTIIMVAKGRGGTEAAGHVFCDGIVSTSRHYLARKVDAPAVLDIFAGSNPQPTFVSLDSPRIIAVEFNAASTLARVGGGAATTVSAGTHTLTGLTVGNRFENVQSCGYIAEFLLYNRALTLAELNDLGGDLGTKWGLTWSTAT